MNQLRCAQMGLHQDEPLELVCLHPDCILSSNLLNCVICTEEHHLGHSIIPLDKLMNLFKHQETNFKDALAQSQSPSDPFNIFKRYDDIIKHFDALAQTFSRNIEAIKQSIITSKNNLKMLTYDMPNYQAFKEAANKKNNNLCTKMIKRILLTLEFNSTTQELQIRDAFLKDQSDEHKEDFAFFDHLKGVADSLTAALGQLGETLKASPTQLNTIMQSNRSISIQKFDYPIEQTTSNYFSNSNKFIQTQKSNFAQKQNDLFLSSSLASFKQETKQKLFHAQSPTSIMPSQVFIPGSYLFSDELIGNGIQVLKNGRQAKLLYDLDNAIVLITPAIYGSGIIRETSIKLKIQVFKQCKNLNMRFPMAVGLCYFNQIKKNSFLFRGKQENQRQTSEKSIPPSHGCVLLNSRGMIRSTSPTIDYCQSIPNLRFNNSSEIHLMFKPFKNQLIIQRDNTLTTCVDLQLDENQNEKIYFCVRMGDLADFVEIL